MKEYRYLLFDADNTLFDFTLSEEISFRNTVTSLGMEYSGDLQAEYSRINDMLWKKLERKEITLEFLKTERFRLLLENHGNGTEKEILEKAVAMRELYMKTLACQSILVDGASEVLHALKKRFDIYIVTNGISVIQRSRLSRSEINDCVKDIFISEEIGVQKPSKEYFDHVLAAVGSDRREEYLVIGDSLTSDCDGAISYGLDICRFNPQGLPDEGRTLTYSVRKLDELYGILGVEND